MNISTMTGEAIAAAPTLEGWRWVPAEATEEIVETLCRESTRADWPDDFGAEAQAIRRHNAIVAYRKAIAAAPHPSIAPDADLAARLESHARIHDEHVPYDDEQARWAADLRAAAAVVRGPDALRAAAEKARAALSDLLLKRDPIVYSDALRALDEALAQTRQPADARGAGDEPIAQPQAAGWADVVEQRLLTWRTRMMNEDGDRPALDDFMDKESIDDLIDCVCAPITEPQTAGWRPIEEAVDCAECDGTGKVPSPETCTRCGYVGCWSITCEKCGGSGSKPHEPPKEGA